MNTPMSTPMSTHLFRAIAAQAPGAHRHGAAA